MPESLKEVKQLEEQAKSAAQSAEKKLSETTNAIAAAEGRTAEIKATLADLEEKEAKKLEEMRRLDEQIAAKQSEARSLEGEVQEHKGTIATLKGDFETLCETLQAKRDTAHKDHQAQMAVYDQAQKKAQDALKGIENTIELKKKELEGIEKVVVRFNQEAKRLETEVLPQIPQLEEKLGNLNHELLVKQKEIQDAEAKRAEAAGKYHDEKVKYDEVYALRLAEEKRVEAELKKLIEKEGEVEKKMASLRNLQEGVDAATARLQRREREIELKNHLSKPKAVT